MPHANNKQYVNRKTKQQKNVVACIGEKMIDEVTWQSIKTNIRREMVWQYITQL